jgi:hypothetical protein
MALPSAGNPISFKQINDELNNSSEATLDLKTASEELGEDTAAFTTALSATADSVDPGKVVLAWAVGVPTGAPSISSFTLQRATDSDISENVSTLSTNAAGSPVNDTGLAGGTQFFYRASATNTAGTTVSNANATTTAARTSIAIKYLQQTETGVETDLFIGWVSNPSLSHLSKGELVLCAEATALPDDDSEQRQFSIQSETDFIADGTLSNSDTLFDGSTGTGVTDIRPNDKLVNQETFLVDTTQNNIFQINTSGVISNVRSRTPNVPTKPTLVANSGTQITVTIPSTNTAVTREFDIHRSIGGGSFSSVGTTVPNDSGSIDDTSISTTFVDSSGISAGNSVVYKVFAQNAFATSSASTTSDSVTTPAGTSWGSISNFNLHIGSGQLGSQELESSEKQLTLTNGSGNTTISIEQPDNSNPPPDLEIKVGNATGNYNLISSYTESPSAIAAASTYFMKFKLSQAGSKLSSAEDCTISFTNNSVTRTFEINVEVASGGLGLCIHELMLVDTPMGQKSIYDLNLGDLVSSYNSELDIVENVPIQQIIKPMHKNLYKVNNLILTEDHPVFDIDGKLLSVSPELTKQRYELNTEKLEIGHILKTLNNEELIVEKIRRYNGEFKTYTILTKNNNFFVDGILVHSEINH